MSFQSRIGHDIAPACAFRGGLVEGANLRTPCGARRVELLRPGDLVVTRTGGLMPLRMIWSRRVTAQDMARDERLAPVHIAPRAVGPLMPQKPLLVASDHRILVPGYRLWGLEDTRSYLVRAAELAGTSDAMFIDRACCDVRYFQLVFDTHQVMLVNGLPVESFLPDPAEIACLAPPLRTALVDLFPQLRREPGAYPPAEYPVARDVAYMPFVL